MKTWRVTTVAALLMTLGTTAQAGVVIGGTRVIYDGAKKEASINISNPDQNIYLIQSWVDGGTASRASTEKAPFVVTPPLFRLNSNQQNILRIVRAGGSLPENKESMFWLNIKSIPSADKTQANTLQIAVKTRIKLIFRPAGVKNALEESAKTLTWKRTGNQLKVTNPSPNYINFFNVKVNGIEVKNANMVAPQSEASFDLPVNATSGSLSWQFINDYGGTSKPLTAGI